VTSLNFKLPLIVLPTISLSHLVPTIIFTFPFAFIEVIILTFPHWLELVEFFVKLVLSLVRSIVTMRQFIAVKLTVAGP